MTRDPVFSLGDITGDLSAPQSQAKFEEKSGETGRSCVGSGAGCCV